MWVNNIAKKQFLQFTKKKKSNFYKGNWKGIEIRDPNSSDYISFGTHKGWTWFAR